MLSVVFTRLFEFCGFLLIRLPHSFDCLSWRTKNVGFWKAIDRPRHNCVELSGRNMIPALYKYQAILTNACIIRDQVEIVPETALFYGKVISRRPSRKNRIGQSIRRIPKPLKKESFVAINGDQPPLTQRRHQK